MELCRLIKCCHHSTHCFDNAVRAQLTRKIVAMLNELNLGANIFYLYIKARARLFVWCVITTQLNRAARNTLGNKSNR